MSKSSSDTTLLLIIVGIIAAPFYIVYKLIGGIGLCVVIILGVAGVILYLKHKKKSERDEFYYLIINTINGNLKNSEDKEILHNYYKKHHRRAEAVRFCQIIRDSIYIALSSKKRDTAEDRMSLLVTTWDKLKYEYNDLLSEMIINQAENIVNEAKNKYHTVLYLNVANSYLEKASSLKTDTAKKKYLSLASQVIMEGLENTNSDKDKLNELLFKAKAMTP